MNRPTFYTRYIGPTDTVGPRVNVTLPDGRHRTRPYDYSAHDAHAAAVAEVTGIPVQFLTQVRPTRTGRGFVYTDARPGPENA